MVQAAALPLHTRTFQGNESSTDAMTELNSNNIPARLRVAEAAAELSPPTVHQYESLESAGVDLEGSRYLLATDDSGRVVGVVSREQIRQRLEADNHQERSRWAGMPVGALMNLVFAETAAPGTHFNDELECVAITEDGGLIGLAVENDVFLSWERLAPMLTVAITDPLTGLMNRMAYDRRLNEEWHRAVRTGTSVGVLVADLDGLKPINDCHGHQAGDAVLQGVASLLEYSLRSYDILARYGGDEFVALCVGCRPGEIAIPIERILHRLTTAEFEFDGQVLPVSLSVGAAVRHDDFSTSCPAELFRAADECMYRAKGTTEHAFTIEFGQGCAGAAVPVHPADEHLQAIRS